MPRHGRTKPVIGPAAKLDVGNPLTNKLIDAWVFNENGGTTWNAVRRIAAPLAGGARWLSDGLDAGVGSSGATGQSTAIDSGTYQLGLTDPQKFTLAWGCVCNAVGTLNVIFDHETSSGDNWYIGVGKVDLGGNSNIGFGTNSSSAGSQRWDNVVSTGVPFDAVITSNGATANGLAWMNGRPLGAPSYTENITYTDLASPTRFLNFNGPFSPLDYPFNGVVHYLYIWNRVLTDQEVRSFYAAGPYSIFRPRPFQTAPVVVIDSQESGGVAHNSTTSPLTWSFTNTAGSLLLVGITNNNTSPGTTPVVSAVSYGGIALTRWSQTGAWDAAHNDNIELWYLISPPFGSNTVSVASNATNDIIGAAISLSGINHSAPLSSAAIIVSGDGSISNPYDNGTGGGTDAHITVSGTTAGNQVIAVTATGTGFTSVVGPTALSALLNVDSHTGGNNLALLRQASPGGSAYLQINSGNDNWGILAVEVRANAGGVTYTATVSCSQGQSATLGTSRLATAFVYDTFTGTDGTGLSTHTPDIGGTWVRVGGGTEVGTLLSNTLTGASFDRATYYNNATPPSADYQVACDIIVVSANHGDQAGPAARFDTGSNSCYRAWLSDSGSGTTATWNLQRDAGGGSLTLGGPTSEPTYAVGQTYHVVLSCAGSTISFVVNGTTLYTATDTFLAGPGYAGLHIGEGLTNNMNLDNLLAFPAVSNYSLTVSCTQGQTASVTPNPGKFLRPIADVATGTLVRATALSTWLRHARQKPSPGPLRINTGHNLGVGLTQAWLFNTVGGPPFDVAGLQRATLTGMTWASAAPYGACLQVVANGDQIDTGVVVGGASGTIVICFLPNSAFNDNTTRTIWGASTSSGVPELVGMKFSDNNLYVGWNAASDGRVTLAASATNWVQSAFQNYTLTWTPTGSVLYREGVQIGSSATVPPTGTAPTSTFAWANENGKGTPQSLAAGAQIAYAYIYNRALAAREVAQLTSEPFVMFQARPAQRWAGGATPATTATSVAVSRNFLRHAQQKPMAGPVKLDAGHPLSQGLLSAYVMAEVGSSGQIVEYAAGHNPGTQNGTITWVSTRAGPGVKFDGSTGFISASGHQHPTFTHAILYQPTQVTTGKPITAMIETGNTGVTDRQIWQTATGAIGCSVFDSTASTTKQTGQTSNMTVAGGPYWIIQCVDGTNLTLVTDKLTNPSPVACGSGYTGYTNPQLLLGKGAITAGSNSNAFGDGTIIAAYIWTRGLSNTELASFMAAPFAMFQARPLQRWSGTASGTAWTNQLGSTLNLYQAINEAAPDDTTYVQSPWRPGSSFYTTRLGAPGSPPGVGNRILHIRYFDDAYGGSMRYWFDLFQGSTLLQSFGPFSPQAARTVLASDPFNRSNNSSLGGNWTAVTGGATTAFGISGNAAVPNNTADDCQSYYTGVPWPNDQYSSAQCSTSGSDGAQNVGVVVRANGSTEATDYNAYTLTADHHTTTTFNLLKWAGASVTTLASWVQPWTNGDTIELDVHGSVLTAFWNGTALGSYTDTSSPITAGSPGIASLGSGSTLTISVDNWVGGGFSSVVTPGEQDLIVTATITDWTTPFDLRITATQLS